LTESDITVLGFNETKQKNLFTKEASFKKGDVVKHKDYGKGKVFNIEKVNGKHLITVDFWDYSCMEFVLEYTKLEKIND